MDITDKHISPPQHSTPLFSDQGSSTMPDSVITKKDNELSILLSLSNEIAAVRSKNDLLQVLNIKLKELFPITGFGITLLNEDGKTHSPFVVDSDDHIRNDIDFIKVIQLKYSVEDGVYNTIVTQSEPVLLNVDEVIPLVETAAYVAFWKKLNVKQVTGFALKVAGKNIGCLIFLLENNTPEKISNDLVKAVCSSVSAAVSNIRFNEEIKEREEEKLILLSLSNEIAAVRNKEDLAKVVNHKLRELFSIREFGIAQISVEGNTYEAFMLELDEPVTSHSDYKEVTSNRYSVEDPVFSYIMKSADPVVFNVSDLVKERGMPAYVYFWKNAGVEQIVAVPLKVGGKDVGAAFLHVETNSIKSLKSDLLKSVCAQLSVAVSNILANEEIKKREEEKTILLSLSYEIASLKHRNDLNRVVNTRIKKLFAINQFGIAQINEDRVTHSAFMMDLGDAIHSHIDFQEITRFKYSITDTAFSSIITSDEPVILDVLQLAQEPDPPAYVHFWKAVGFRKLLCLALRVGENNVGCIFFNINPNEINNLNTGLLKGVCAQLSLAVSNIIANEKIKKANEEKSLLLSFSNDIATVRDKEGLRLIFKQYLKNIFHIKEYIITTRNNDGNAYSYFMHDSEAADPDDEGWKIMLSNRIPVKGAFIGAVLQSEGAIFDIEKRLREGKFYFPAASFWKAAGAKKVMGFRLMVADKDVGLLVIQPGQVNIHLLKGISAQLAIAIANIAAIEEIVVREKEKSSLLEFSNAIASIREKYTLAKVLSHQLKDLFGIEDYAIHALSEDKKTHRPILYDPDAAFAKTPIFQQMIAQPSDVNDGVFNSVLNASDVVSFSIDDWVHSPKPPSYTDAAVSLGIIKLAGVAIRLGDEAIAVMNFKHDESNLFKIKKQLFKSICSQLAITVSNLIANEKIENQLHEINTYKQQLEEEKIYLKEEIATTLNYDEIIGESPEIQKTFHLIKQVAPSDSTVLLQGETGTGKELIARAIHNSSPRKNKLMVKLNCAALPANLIESELFGHERGSFTGATERRIGKFELAHHGTLFLDEIGEMPLELQVKLLRALQEQEIERIGGRTTIKVDVRIIAATNRDLEKEMEEGRFRSDLYYRLNIFPINLPPLRNRKEDIPMLASNFIARFAKKSGKQISGLSKKALQELIQYNWPGNIRELEHLIERSVLLTTGDIIKEIYLPSVKQSKSNLLSEEVGTVKTIDENEKEYILKTLKQVKGRISGEGGAAELLGVPPSTLNSKIKRLGISRRFTTESHRK